MGKSHLNLGGLTGGLILIALLAVSAFSIDGPGTAKRGVVNFAPPKTIEAAPEGFSGKTLLANADFDEDGMPDLVVARVSGSGTNISILSGNVRSIHPNAPIDGVNVLDIPADQPFFRREGIVDTGLSDVTAEFVGAGDFDADGHRDVVLADNQCQCLVYLLGDGKGGFSTRDTATVGFNIRVLKVAEVNRYDGLEDVVLGVDSPYGGGAIVVFEGPKGALPATPEAYLTKNQISDLSIGTIDKDHLYDIAIANGNDLTVIWGRDRKLTWEPEVREQIQKAHWTSWTFRSELASLEFGKFRRGLRTELMILDRSGNVKIIGFNGREGTSSTVATGFDPGSNIAKGKFFCADVDCVTFTSSERFSILPLETGDRAVLPLSRSYDMNGGSFLPMQLNSDALEDIVISGSFGVAVMVTMAVDTFTVTNTDDSGPGSFRRAVADANSNPGADRIVFAIGTGLQRIALGALGPVVISEAVEIDGFTQGPPGTSPRIEINKGYIGASAGGGLRILSNSCVLQGLRFVNFVSDKAHIYAVEIAGDGNIVRSSVFGSEAGADEPNDTGVWISGELNTIGGGPIASRNLFRKNFRGIELVSEGSNMIQGNHILQNDMGLSVIPEVFSEGILAANDTGSQTNTGLNITNNVISGSGRLGFGIKLNDSIDVRVTNNLIGLTPTGMEALPQFEGIQIQGGTSALITSNTISGNVTPTGQGAGLVSFSNDTQIQDNLIGLATSGVDAVPNGFGIILGAGGGLIGGDAPQVRNHVSGNAGDQILLEVGAGGLGVVQGNVVGLRVGGGNPGGKTGGGSGIGGTSSSGTIRVGGQSPGARNVISGNDLHGVSLGVVGSGTGVSNIEIRGNCIGTTYACDEMIEGTGNGLSGVRLESLATTISIVSNLIAYNGESGIALPGTTGSAASNIEISQNHIYLNGPQPDTGTNDLLNVDLGPVGQTPNDEGDADIGGNGLQNYPLISNAIRSGSNVSVSGSFNSLGSNRYRIEFFYSEGCTSDAPNSVSRFLGSAIITTGNSTSFTPYAATFPLPKDFPPSGARIQAVAINDPGTGIQAEAKNSSEYSPCFAVAVGTPTPTSTPTASPTPAGFEGDVAPRPQGDGAMGSTDVVQLRRFASALDTPNPAFNEAQRADCAPRATGGDGQINSADVIQTRRYAAGIDPIEPAGGAIPSIVEEFGDVLGIGTSKADSGFVLEISKPVDVLPYSQRIPIKLKSLEDVSAVSFSIEFDPSRLSNPRLVLSDSFVTERVVTLNRNYEADGRLGILIDSSDTVNDGDEIGYLVFERIADGEVSVAVGDFPIRRSAAGPDGNLIEFSRPDSNRQSQRSLISSLFGYVTRFAS